MEKKKVQSFINLETFASGAFSEKLTEALSQVAENIQNPNTEATTKRQINIAIKFAPNKTRQLVNTQISVTTKLAATESIDTQMIMGINMRTGQIEIAEYDGQIRGQLSLDLSAAEKQEGGDEEEQTQSSLGRPIDLKNRNLVEDALVPGRDFDLETGEIISRDNKTEEISKVVKVENRTMNA